MAGARLVLIIQQRVVRQFDRNVIFSRNRLATFAAFSAATAAAGLVKSMTRRFAPAHPKRFCKQFETGRRHCDGHAGEPPLAADGITGEVRSAPGAQRGDRSPALHPMLLRGASSQARRNFA